MPESNIVANFIDSQKFPPKYYTDSNLIKPCNRLLTQAELQAINATPIELVAAPGAGYIVAVVGNVYFLMNYNGTQWVADDLDLYYDTGNKFVSMLEADIELTSDAFAVTPISKVLATENKGIFATSNTDFTANGSPIRVFFNYQIIAI